jgi:Lrp/AsnC family transcriptional regulator, regulator for asnA, asnC and gidA
MDIDEIDVAILKEVQEDSKTSYRDIAKKLGLSVGTVHNRVKKMSEMGVIKSFAAVLDPEKLGFDLTAVILMQVDGGHIVDVERAIAKSKSVMAVYDTTGDYDIITIAKFRSREELNTFIKETLKMPNVKRSVTSIVLNVVKEEIRLNL